MTVLVTGATGFIGSAVARALLAAGQEVRVLVRASSNLANVDKLPVSLVRGDLTDPDSLREPISGCRWVFHVAADYRLWARDPSVLYKANVEGTRNVLDAASKEGVERVVYTSSVATLGLNHDGSPADEATPTSLDEMVGHYKRSKYLAEQEALRWVREQGLDVVIVNPSAPVGPRDIKPTPTGRMILDAAAGRMPAYVDTGLNIVHVDDVATGHIQAAERGRTGERYILGKTNMDLREIFATVAEITGGKPPRVRLPNRLVLPIAYVSEGIARITGNEPRVTVDGVRLARKKMFFSSDKAIRELGYDPRPARQAIEDAIAWFRAQGYFQHAA